MSELLPVKSFQETLHESFCGPASLKIVFDFYGIEKTEEELAELSEWNKILGVSDQGMKKAAEKLGYTVDIVNEATFEQVASWLERSVPVIVNWFTKGRSDYGDSEVADGHSSVVIGLDEEFIYLQDPEIGGIRKLTRNDFMRVWFDFSEEFISRDNLVVRQFIAIYQK